MRDWAFPVLALAVGYFGAKEWSEAPESFKAGGEGSESRTRVLKAGQGVEGGSFEQRLRDLKTNGYSRGDREAIFKEWFREDPEAALKALESSHKPSFLLGFLFEDDPQGLELMGKYLDDVITSGQWHESGFDGEIDRRFRFNVGKELVDKVASLPESHMKKELWKYVMAGWFFEDWRGAKAHVTGLAGEARSEAERAFLSERLPRWVSRDAEGRKWVEKILTKEGNRDLLTWQGPKFVSAMSREDPESALKWADENLAGTALVSSISTVVGQLVRTDIAKAEALVDGMNPGGGRERVARALVLGTARKDPVAAFQRARNEEEMGMKMGVQTWLALGRTLGGKAPAEARKVIESGEELEKVFSSYAMNEAFWREPAETKRWAEEMEGPRREEVIDLVFRAWHLREQEQAKAWRDRQKSGS